MVPVYSVLPVTGLTSIGDSCPASTPIDLLKLILTEPRLPFATHQAVENEYFSLKRNSFWQRLISSVFCDLWSGPFSLHVSVRVSVPCIDPPAHTLYLPLHHPVNGVILVHAHFYFSEPCLEVFFQGEAELISSFSDAVKKEFLSCFVLGKVVKGMMIAEPIMFSDLQKIKFPNELEREVSLGA